MGMDVFNCLDVMENAAFIGPLKFGLGDGLLRYYLFNWRTTPLTNGSVALLML